MIQYYIVHETDEELRHTASKVIQGLETRAPADFSPFIEITSVDSINGKRKYYYEDVIVQTRKDKEGDPFRQLTTFVNVNRNNYKIVCRISLLEKDDMVFSTFLIIITFLFFLLAFLVFVNKYVSKRVLKDFYDTLKKLDHFSLQNDDRLLLAKSNIEEFEQLNQSLILLAERAKNEYRSLKEFSEEVNHEIQTPMAVIKSKMELLLQSPSLNEDITIIAQTILKSLAKLERLNKSILLLNKLEHKNLFEEEEVDINTEIKNVATTLDDFINIKNLSLELFIEDKKNIKANQSLINILFSNLISNAIKHNIKDGKINIVLKDNQLTIANTGLAPKSDTGKFFVKFYKESKSQDSVGLGLTIVKKICELYGIDIKYTYSANMHNVILDFKE